MQKVKSIMVISDQTKIMLEGKVFAQTSSHYLVVNGSKRTWINKYEYLKNLN